ncbi:MAG: hypothetical protein ACJAUB_000382 [Cryomorphaceae bacterium]|jgi:hypothetical protein
MDYFKRVLPILRFEILKAIESKSEDEHFHLKTMI